MKAAILAAVCAVALTAATPDSKTVFDAIFRNDANALNNLSKDRDAANVKDDRETTALMYACAFGSLDSVKLLIERGADVNAANGLGSTALMWATSEPAKVKLLLEHGANVNAKSKSGRTALIVAASRPGSDDVVNQLLAKGADIKAADEDGTTFLIAAASWGNSHQVETALGRGADPNAADAGGFTPLIDAAAYSDLKSVKLLLAKGAKVNAVSKDDFATVLNGPINLGRFTALHFAVTYGPAALVDELLRAGADPNVKDIRGYTPLLIANASEHRDPEIVKLLLKAGAEKTAASEEWLAKYSSSAAPHLGEESQQTVERAVSLLRTTSTNFMKTGGCIACHAQPASVMALRTARDHGYKYTDEDLREHMPLAKGFWSSQTDRLILRNDPPGGSDTVVYNLFLLASMDYPADTMTSAMLLNLLEQQEPAGHMHGSAFGRAPMEDSDVTHTAMMLRAFQVFSWPGHKSDLDARISRAHDWLRKARPVFNEEYAMQVLGLHWAGDAAVSNYSAKLAAMQNADGGWSQNPHLTSDAYATGMTLYALHEAGMPASDPVYKRGIHFLKATQQADGSWHVMSRSPKLQPYFESGFPHGHDQWISSMATAWAAMACAM